MYEPVKPALETVDHWCGISVIIRNSRINNRIKRMPIWAVVSVSNISDLSLLRALEREQDRGNLIHADGKKGNVRYESAVSYVHGLELPCSRGCLEPTAMRHRFSDHK
jgi:hypothetical protein